MITKEAIMHQQVCDYIRLHYRDVIFRTDHSAGLKLTLNQAVRHKRLQSGRAYPDLFLPEPRGGYHGLFLELKAVNIYLKSGSLSNSTHIREQEQVLKALRDRGYRAEFAVGFNNAVKIIDAYLAM